MKITAEELAKIIDVAYKGVDQSCIGPVLAPAQPYVAATYNTLAFEAFKICLHNLIPTNVSQESTGTVTTTVRHEKEEWLGGNGE